jgi:hypothetical protein
MRVRLAPFSAILAMLAGCAAISSLEVDTSEVESPPFPECRAESYAFAGRGTFAGLGLVGQSAAPLPDPNREAMIWVTRDPVAFDAAAPDGGSRMLCFEFEDGSGGSEWPIAAAWQPPGRAAPAEIDLVLPLLLLALVIVSAAFAFRRR